MSQPEGFVDSTKPDHVCKLNKALYGLKQAPRAWYDKLKDFLVKWGFTGSTSDTSLFIFKRQGSIFLVLVYVDDILITGDDLQLISQVIVDLGGAFALKTLGEVSYVLGLEAKRSSNVLHLTQTKYIHDLLVKTNLTMCRSSSTPTCLNQKVAMRDSRLFDMPSLYRNTVGALQYLTLTRPDIAFAVNELSQFLHAPTVNHWTACKRILRYLQGTSTVGLVFKPATRMLLEGYADVDWASNLDDRRSTSGNCVFLGGNIICWSSRKQRVVVRRSTKYEYQALASAATELVWLNSLFKELGITLEQPSVLWCDNIGAASLASNPVFHAPTKHIEIDDHFIREKVLSKEIDVRFVPSEEQTADVFTKALFVSKFHYLCSKLSLGISLV